MVAAVVVAAEAVVVAAVAVALPGAEPAPVVAAAAHKRTPRYPKLGRGKRWK